MKQARSLVEEAIHRFGIHHACGFSETCEDSRPWRVPPLEVFMGDKSPKQKDKAKKQDTAGKNQKKASADAKQQKANPADKKGK